MKPDDELFLKEFFNAVADRPLEPDDPRYVSLYDEALTDDDPVQQLARAVEWSTESVRLFSGYRGAGKSTELRRLKRQLEDAGHLVFLCDMEDYLNLSTAVDVSDFLMAVAGSFDDAIRNTYGGNLASSESYWERLKELVSNWEIEKVNVSAGVSALGIKASLKSDPTFTLRLRKAAEGNLGALVADMHEFCRSRVDALRGHMDPPDRKIVLLLDSVEHIRGPFAIAEAVQSSVENLFAGHATKLRIPELHVVYTVPTYLKVRYPHISQLYEEGALGILPSFKLHEQDGTPIEAAYAAFEKVVGERGNWQRLLGHDRAVLRNLIRNSGGHLRTLLHMLREVAIRARTLPVAGSAVAAAVDHLKAEFLPIPNDDARWLAKISETHQAELQSLQELPSLARFFDTNLVLCYRNGDEWYDVHPLIEEQVRKQAAVPDRRANDLVDTR